MLNIETHFPKSRILAGDLTPEDYALITAALNTNSVEIKTDRRIKTRFPIDIDESKRTLRARVGFGTANPVPVHMEFIFWSDDRLRCIGFLGEEYPRASLRGRDARNYWYMLEKAS